MTCAVWGPGQQPSSWIGPANEQPRSVRAHCPWGGTVGPPMVRWFVDGRVANAASLVVGRDTPLVLAGGAAGYHDFLAIRGGESLVFSAEVQAIHTFLWKTRHHADNAVQSHPAPRGDLTVVITDPFGNTIDGQSRCWLAAGR